MAQRKQLATIPTAAEAEVIQALSQREVKAMEEKNAQDYAQVKEQTRERARKANKVFAGAQSLLDQRKIEAITNKMADDINRHLAGTVPLVLTLYFEGAHFSNHLTKKLGDRDLTLEENYLDFRVEGDGPTLMVEPTTKLEGRTVLLVDAALRDGKKMQAALDYCKAKGARAVYCATLIDMPEARAEQHKKLKPSFSGAVCTNQPLIGFGFGVDGFFRNEPGIWSLPGTPASSGPTNTGGILAALEQKPEPLVFQPEIPANKEALAKAREAEETFKKLDLLYTGQQVKEKIAVTAQQMKEQLKDTNPVVLSMQKGGSHFTTLLTEHLSGLPLEESYMHITRYGNSTTGGKAKLLAAPAVDVKGRTVIISEDLIEGGLTIQMGVSLCLQRGAAAVYVAAMGDKPQKRLSGLDFIKPDFNCYRFEGDKDRFLVGTGLDERETLRNKFGVWAHPKKEEAPSPAAPISAPQLS